MNFFSDRNQTLIVAHVTRPLRLDTVEHYNLGRCMATFRISQPAFLYELQMLMPTTREQVTIIAMTIVYL